MKKSALILTSLAVAGTIGAGVGSADLASAQTTTATSATTTAQATKKAENRQIRLHARLNQAVRDGTITSAQKTAFEAELKTLKSERKAALSKSSTPTERQAERAKLKAELQAWAISNNFPLAKIAPKLAS